MYTNELKYIIKLEAFDSRILVPMFKDLFKFCITNNSNFLSQNINTQGPSLHIFSYI